MSAAVAWPPECLELTRTLIASKSASSIAAELHRVHGFSVSRNAVLGMIHRSKGKEGWPPKTERTERPARPKKQPRYEGGVQAIHKAARIADLAKPFKTLTKAENAAYDAASRHLPLADLPAGTCHWPVNDAERGETFLFCGMPAETKRYCSHHHSRAHRPSNLET